MVFAKRFGESANLSNKIVNNLKEKLLQIAEGYRTGPCFKTANNKTLFHKGERCSGGKKSKMCDNYAQYKNDGRKEKAPKDLEAL